jgi:drug/metabolite transporter (DMT)-like permease
MSTVRIPWYAQRVAPLRLAFGKSLVLAAVAAAALGTQALALGGGPPTLGELWPACCDQSTAWALIAWSAVGPGALSAFLHVKGQSLVGPTDAQVVFATVPLWSAVLAWALLPGESVGALTWVGGGGLLVAGLVAGLGQRGAAAGAAEEAKRE